MPGAPRLLIYRDDRKNLNNFASAATSQQWQKMFFELSGVSTTFTA